MTGRIFRSTMLVETVVLLSSLGFIMGVRSLLSEIVHDLCENVVKYHIAGGTVKITV